MLLIYSDCLESLILIPDFLCYRGSRCGTVVVVKSTWWLWEEVNLACATRRAGRKLRDENDHNVHICVLGWDERQGYFIGIWISILHQVSTLFLELLDIVVSLIVTRLAWCYHVSYSDCLILRTDRKEGWMAIWFKKNIGSAHSISYLFNFYLL